MKGTMNADQNRTLSWAGDFLAQFRRQNHPYCPRYVKKKLAEIKDQLKGQGLNLADIGTSDSEMDEIIRLSYRDHVPVCLKSIFDWIEMNVNTQNGVGDLKEALQSGGLSLEQLELDGGKKELLRCLLKLA